MKNLIAAFLGLGLIFQGNYVAAQCVNSSRCGQLGYTKSPNDCIGLPTLICPFDSGKAFCMPISSTGETMTCDQFKSKVNLFNQTVVLNNHIKDCSEDDTINLAEGVTVIGAINSKVEISNNGINTVSLTGNPQKLQNLKIYSFSGSVNEVDNVEFRDSLSVNSDVTINNIYGGQYFGLSIYGTAILNNITLSNKKFYSIDLRDKANLVMEGPVITNILRQYGTVTLNNNVFVGSLRLSGGTLVINGDLATEGVIDCFTDNEVECRIKANKAFIDIYSQTITYDYRIPFWDVPEVYYKDDASGTTYISGKFKKGTIFAFYVIKDNNCKTCGKWRFNKDCTFYNERIWGGTSFEPSENFTDCLTRIGDYDGSNWPVKPTD